VKNQTFEIRKPKSRFPVPKEVRFIFAAMSSVMFVILLIFLADLFLYIKKAKLTDGTVIQLVRPNCHQLRCRSIKVPIIQYEADNGQVMTFQAHSSGYQVGERVQLYYVDEEPRKPILNNWTELLGGELGLSTFMLVLGSIGFRYPITNGIYAIKRIIGTRFGKPIIAKFDQIGRGWIINRDRENRGFKIIATWYNPETKQYHKFHSRIFWYDPTPYIDNSRDITIYVSRNLPWMYWMDVDFLPKPLRF
jgi:hypothetical protein